jgi:hypothetical protein
MGIVTLAAAKKKLKIPPENITLDNEVQLYVDAVGGAVDLARGEAVGPRTVTDQVAVSRGEAVLTTVPVSEVTSVTSVDGTQTWTVASLHVNPTTGVLAALIGPPLSGTVEVTYTAGYDPVPPNYVLAALIILQHLWTTERGSNGNGVRYTSEGEVAPPPGYAIPWRAAELLGSTLPGIA